MYKIGKFIFVESGEFPQQIVKEGIIYVNNEDKIATFKCPCGCSEVIVLNLIPDTHPCWSINGNTIKPSIQKLSGCKSHFQIINGEIK